MTTKPLTPDKLNRLAVIQSEIGKLCDKLDAIRGDEYDPVGDVWKLLVVGHHIINSLVTPAPPAAEGGGT